MNMVVKRFHDSQHNLLSCLNQVCMVEWNTAFLNCRVEVRVDGRRTALDSDAAIQGFEFSLWLASGNRSPLRLGKQFFSSWNDFNIWVSVFNSCSYTQVLRMKFSDYFIICCDLRLWIHADVFYVPLKYILLNLSHWTSNYRWD